MKRKVPTLTAKRVATPGHAQLPDGSEILTAPSDYLIAVGTQLLDVVTAKQLDVNYDVIREGDLTLTREECRRLEATTGLGSTGSGPALCAAVERLAAIEVGEVKIEFTPGQLEEIAYRAKKRGRTVFDELSAVVARIKDELFHRGG